MAGSVSKLVERMRWWCDEANLGYCQANRQDMRVDGEADCSSLVIHCLKEAGFDVGSAMYTGNLRANLVARGWVVCKVDGSPRVGDILLNDGRHVAVCTAAGMVSEASINEKGTANGGAPGDQTGLETRTRKYNSYPWSCYLRYAAAQTGGPSGTADELARRVIAGEFGSGNARRGALGSRYAEVQARVNEILHGGVSGGTQPSMDELARAVIAGRYGVGEARRKALGSRYAEVQRRVNQLLS